MSSLLVPIIVGQLLTHDGPIIRFFGIPLLEIALEGSGSYLLGGVIKSFGIGSLPSSPRLWLFPAAFGIGTSAKLEESINIKINIPIMPIDEVDVKQEDNYYQYLYILQTYKRS